MLCGPTTKHGPVSGHLAAACVKAIPELAALGVGSELWLGETDDYGMATSLMKDPGATVKALAKLGKENPGIVGFNFDLEVSKVSPHVHRRPRVSVFWLVFHIQPYVVIVIPYPSICAHMENSRKPRTHTYTRNSWVT